MSIYNKTQWAADKSFNAFPGQEITEEIYNEMLNCMPPLTLPTEKAQQALQIYKIPIHAGFLMGEPFSNDQEGLTYLSFGMSDYGKGKHYYYLGLCHETEHFNGTYYYMDCLNAFINTILFKASEFENEQEAIRIAANYEATLYKFEYVNGKQISNTILYDPFKCFEPLITESKERNY